MTVIWLAESSSASRDSDEELEEDDDFGAKRSDERLLNLKMHRGSQKNPEVEPKAAMVNGLTHSLLYFAQYSTNHVLHRRKVGLYNPGFVGQTPAAFDLPEVLHGHINARTGQKPGGLRQKTGIIKPMWRCGEAVSKFGNKIICK